jgi:hypothetical protein
MQYMLLIYHDEKQMEKMPAGQRGQVHQDYLEYTQAIVKSGQFRAGAALQPTATATTVRQKNGRSIPTDGPFAETKEQLGGYYLVECQNLDEAVSLAARVPSVRVGGSIEVRPVRDMSQE